MRHTMLRPFIVKVPILGYFPLAYNYTYTYANVLTMIYSSIWLRH